MLKFVQQISISTVVEVEFCFAKFYICFVNKNNKLCKKFRTYSNSGEQIQTW